MQQQRDQYPLAADDTCLLIDPTAEDPADHLVLLLSSGVYDPRTDKGEATIEVFGLNRPDLIAGRKDAFFTARAIFRDWYELHKDGDPDADTTAQALLNSPFIDVVYAMTRLKPHLAETVVGPRTVPALQHWRSVHGGIPGTRI